MSSNFETMLYMTSLATYDFAFPLDTKIQGVDVADELEIQRMEILNWKPEWKTLTLYSRDKFVEQLTNDNFVYIRESHPCREIALGKGQYFMELRQAYTVCYRNAFTTITYADQVPASFRTIVTMALLDTYAANREHSTIHCDLGAPNFGIGMNPAYWNKAWLSLLTYFAKYGSYMEELACESYGTKLDYSLNEAIHVILDSWEGQVGFYTAFGLWRWANNVGAVTQGNYITSNGIHSAMDDYTRLYDPNSLLEFVTIFGLGLDRVSRAFIANNRERIILEDFQIPYWYDRGFNNDDHLAESPQWNEYMGYDDEDGMGEGEYAEDEYGNTMYDEYGDPIYAADYDFEGDW